MEDSEPRRLSSFSPPPSVHTVAVLRLEKQVRISVVDDVYVYGFNKMVSILLDRKSVV